MRIPLVFNASPSRLLKNGSTAIIPVDKGRWRVVAENLLDTILSIHYGPPSGDHINFVLDGTLEFDMHTAGVVYAKIKTVGCEPAISLYLERA